MELEFLGDEPLGVEGDDLRGGLLLGMIDLDRPVRFAAPNEAKVALVELALQKGRAVWAKLGLRELDCLLDVQLHTLDPFLGVHKTQSEAGGATGRDVTPSILARLHELSGGATLAANEALVEANAGLAARLAVAAHAQEATS